MTDERVVEIVVAKWSGPALAAADALERYCQEHGWTVIVHDHDTSKIVEADPEQFHGWGECRLNGGKWVRVPELLEELTDADGRDRVWERMLAERPELENLVLEVPEFRGIWRAIAWARKRLGFDRSETP